MVLVHPQPILTKIIQITDPDYRFGLQIRITGSDYRSGLQIRITDSNPRSGLQIRITDSDYMEIKITIHL